MNQDESIPIKKAINELLETNLFKEIAKRNNKHFAQNLAVWLIRYILVVSSMNEALKITLEGALINLHGEQFEKILQITEKTFQSTKVDDEGDQKYIQ